MSNCVSLNSIYLINDINMLYTEYIGYCVITVLKQDANNSQLRM